jgi:addiction module HigA family antidote
MLQRLKKISRSHRPTDLNISKARRKGITPFESMINGGLPSNLKVARLLRFLLSIIIERRDAMNKDYIETPTIGEIIQEEFLEPFHITPYRLSKELNVSTSTVLDLLHNKRKLSVEMALRLSKYFGNSYKFWLNLQNELEIRETQKKIGKELEKIHAYG